MMRQTDNRTLVSQALPGIGDTVWHIPFFKAIADFNPPHPVDLLTIKRSMADQLLSSEPYIGNIFWLDDALQGKGRLRGMLSLAKKLRALRYQHVWVLHKNYRWSLVAMLAGIPERWGYGVGLQRLFLNRGKYLPHQGKKWHPIDQAVNFLKLNRLIVEESVPALSVSSARKSGIEDKFKAHPKPWLAFGIGTTDQNRQWGAENFARLAIQIQQQTGGTIFLVGAAAEEKIANDIIALAAQENVRAIVKLMSCPLADVCALFNACDIYVGNDTGMLHISASVGTPSIGLFGMNYKKINTLRLSDEKRGIHGIYPPELKTEIGVSLMHQISVSSVMSKIRQLLEKQAPAS
jgi:heptosyltransferase-2